MSTPATYTFTIYQGQTWSNILALKDSAGVAQDLTGYTARMQLRKNIEDTDPVLELTTVNSRLTISGVAGTITILVDAATMTALPLEDHQTETWVYDLEIISAGAAVTRVMQGAVVAVPEVTR